MSFLEMRFPESIAFNSSSIVEFNTTIVQTKNGSEQRNVNWLNNKMKFNVVNGIKTKAELNSLLSFFRNVKGRAYGFRFKDWSDYNAENQAIGVGDGETKEFQLIKTYTINGNTYIRKILKPVISTVHVFIDNVESENFDIDFSSGLITFTTAPQINSQISATFEFDVPVRFDSDLLEISMDTLNTGNIKNITLVEIE